MFTISSVLDEGNMQCCVWLHELAPESAPAELRVWKSRSRSQEFEMPRTGAGAKVFQFIKTQHW